MALIECFECKKQISDKAAACPSCGAPVSLTFTRPARKAEPSKPLNRWFSACLICVVLLGAWGYHNAKERAARKERVRLAAVQEAQARQRKLETAQNIALIIGQFQALNEVNQVASATPRIALSGQIVRMQAILRETEALPIIGCLAPAKQAAVDGMRELIHAYLAFMRQDSNTLQISRSAGHIKTAKERMDVCIAQSRTL